MKHTKEELEKWYIEIMKHTKEELEKMRKELAVRDIEQSDDKCLYSIFREGCVGWDNFDDDFVVEQYNENILFTEE